MAAKPKRVPQPNAISPEKLTAALADLRRVAAELAKADPGIAEDEQLMHDMLDGEAGDAIDVLRSIMSAAIEARCFAHALKDRQQQLAARAHAQFARAERLELVVANSLRSLGMPRLIGLDGDLTLRQGCMRVVVEDAALLPSMYKRQPPEEPALDVMAAAFRANAGQAIDPAKPGGNVFSIPGARFERGADSHTVTIR